MLRLNNVMAGTLRSKLHAQGLSSIPYPEMNQPISSF